jgi:hypothetical protein
MKKILMSLLISVFSFNALALVADVSPIDYQIPIERLEILKPVADVDGVVINMVQVDNGGSTNVSSLFLPSSIYITFFVQGEEYDVAASYQLYNNAVKLYDVTYDANSRTASFLVELVDRNSESYPVQTIVERGTVHLGDAIDEALAGQATEKLTSTIGLSIIQ